MTTTWARLRAAVSRLLRPPGRHRADALTAAPVLAESAADPPRPPLAAACSPAMMTMLDLQPVRVAPYVPQRREGRHRDG